MILLPADSPFQIQTQEQKELYNEPGERKHPSGRKPASSSEGGKGEDKDPPAGTGRREAEIRNSQYGAVREILRIPFVRFPRI